MSKLMISVLAAAGMAAAGGAGSAPIARDAYNAQKDRIEATYKQEKQACDSMKGNAKDVCEEQAKAKEKIAKAENEAAYKDTDAARQDVLIARAEANYEVAKEKCDDLSGNQKDVCVKEAKAAETKAKADAKAARSTAEARRDAAEDKRDADYKVAMERCDSMSGGAKDQCQREAKARFGKT